MSPVGRLLAIFLLLGSLIAQAMEPCKDGYVRLDGGARLAQATVLQKYATRWTRSFRRVVGPGWLGESAAVREFRQAFERNDPRVAIMRELGVHFDFEGAKERRSPFLLRLFHSKGDGEPVHIPELPLVLGRYHQILDRNIHDGKLDRENSLSPGAAYRDRDGKVHFLDLLTEPDPSWTSIDLSNEAGIFVRMLAAGYFPLLANDRVEHDFAHLTAVLQYPDYMTGVRQMARRILSLPDKASRDRVGARLFYLYEGLSLVPAEKRGELVKVLSKSFQGGDPDRLITVKEVKEQLRALPAPELIAHARRLLARYPSLVISYGGAVRELNHIHLDPRLSDSPGNLRQNVENNLSGSNLPFLVSQLAHLEVALWESTRTTPGRFVEEAMEVDVDPRSALYRRFVLSGVSGGDPDSPFSQSYMYGSVRGPESRQ